VEARVDEVGVRPNEDLSFVTSGEVELYGEPDNLVLSGGLSVEKLRYDKPLDLESFLKDVSRTREKLAQSSQVDRRSKEWLKLNVGVELEDVQIDNNLARARLQGKVTLSGTNARPGLMGVVEAAEGGQAFFRQNRFDISELLIEMKDRYSIDAVFDLHAQSQVREYLVKLHAFGHPNEPKIILTSEPALAEGDVLSLLTLGITSRDKSQSTGVETASYLAAEALYSASGLDREVQRFLPKGNQVVKDLSFHFSTSYNDALHQMEPAAQIESRLLTDDLKLELTRPFSGRGTRARAQYRLLDGVLVQGQWDNESSSSSDLGNFGVDLKLHWEVK
jgi:translocation and assembly module TamB